MIQLLPIVLSLSLAGEGLSDPPALGIDPSATTLSGISAGGYFANQLHVAYSDVFHGAGIVAGGPFGCAEGSLGTAMSRCMGAVSEPIDTDKLLAGIEAAAAEGRVAPTAALRDDPVWLFRGRQDATVPAVVADALHALYRDLSDHVVYITDVDAAHSFPTLDRGQPCDASAAPFIGACAYDAAGKILTYLYGDLETPEGPAGEITTIETEAPEAAHVMDDAFLYAPPDCLGQAADCRLHVVLHGCAQSAATIDTLFVEQSGYLRWADPNGIVLLFPQVKPSAINPYACWDWWGYSGGDYLDRGAAQMQAVVDLVRRISQDD